MKILGIVEVNRPVSQKDLEIAQLRLQVEGLGRQIDDRDREIREDQMRHDSQIADMRTQA